jgi:hypothetical protein
VGGGAVHADAMAAIKAAEPSAGIARLEMLFIPFLQEFFELSLSILFIETNSQ